MLIKRAGYCLLLILALLASSSAAWSNPESEFQFEHSREEFLEQVFTKNIPEPRRVWLRGEIKQKLEAVLQHKLGFLRTQYWQNDGLSVWILDEIGKERPITTAVVVEHAQGESTIREVKVLAYRESRGWEVKHGFFTRQFEGLSLKHQGRSPPRLSGAVDGITGATLSVRALKKTAQIALILDQHVRSQTP